jgi:DNA-binding transcriptional ArsR family regulator
MIEDSQNRLDEVFQALSHGTRREIVNLLSARPLKIGELVPRFDMSFAAVSKHVKILENAGIVEREINGRTHTCRLNAEALNEAYAWLGGYEKFWTMRLDALKTILENGGA